MIKDISSFGKILDKKEQTKVNGGFLGGGGDPFIGSSCYSQRRFCNAALASAIANGADPTQTSCVPCPGGWEVRIFGTL